MLQQPSGQHIIVGDESAVLLSEKGFDEDTDGVGHLGQVLDDTLLLKLLKTVDGDVPLGCGEGLPAICDVGHCVHLGFPNNPILLKRARQKSEYLHVKVLLTTIAFEYR